MGIYKAYEAYKFPVGAVEPEFLTGTPAQWTPNPLPGLAGLALSPGCGVLWYCPPLFLSWRGWQVRRRRRRQRPFSRAVLVSSLIFTVFLCFLTFFKGEPCWGPRYMTPVFALCWVFVPAGCATVRIGARKGRVGVGVGSAAFGPECRTSAAVRSIAVALGILQRFPLVGL